MILVASLSQERTMNARRRRVVKRTVLLDPEHAEFCQWIGSTLYSNMWPRVNHSLVCNLICHAFMEILLDSAEHNHSLTLHERVIRRTREWVLGKRKFTPEEMKTVKTRLEGLSQIGLLNPE